MNYALGTALVASLITNILLAVMFIRAADNYCNALTAIEMYVPHIYSKLFGDQAKEARHG